MERIAIIDLGSNSIRFIIMQIGEHGARSEERRVGKEC